MPRTKAEIKADANKLAKQIQEGVQKLKDLQAELDAVNGSSTEKVTVLSPSARDVSW